MFSQKSQISITSNNEEKLKYWSQHSQFVSQKTDNYQLQLYYEILLSENFLNDFCAWIQVCITIKKSL